MSEIERLDKKLEEYKSRISKGKLKLDIAFETDISKIEIRNLRTELNDDLQKDYGVVFLEIDKVIPLVRNDWDTIFSKTDLFVMKEYIDTARLIEFIEAGNKIYPPILTPIDKTKIAVRDGNHRIGLLRYMGYNVIPFLVRKDRVYLISV